MSNPWIVKLRACSAEYQQEKKKEEETKKRRIRDIKEQLRDIELSYPQRDGKFNNGRTGTINRPFLEKQYRTLNDELFKLTGERKYPLKVSERGWKKEARKEYSAEIQAEIRAEKQGKKKKDKGKEFIEPKRTTKKKPTINF